MTEATQLRVLALDGVLNIRKEAGWTSHDVVAKVRRCIGGGRVGHAGTLDPAAVGVLPLLVGKATRIAEYLVHWDKEYVAVLRLGETTNTQDATGTILTVRSTQPLTEAAIRSVVGRFRGQLRQIPPMYSAVKVAGVPLYKAARAGRTVRREARDVIVHELDVLSIVGRDVTLRVSCSKGTYIRTLCADIGEALGVGGHLLQLTRTRVGPLSLGEALPVEDVCERLLQAGSMDLLAAGLVPIDHALVNLSAVTLTNAAATRVRHGVPVGADGLVPPQTHPLHAGDSVRLKDTAGRLLALGRVPLDAVDVAGHLTGLIKVTKVFTED